MEHNQDMKRTNKRCSSPLTHIFGDDGSMKLWRYDFLLSSNEEPFGGSTTAVKTMSISTAAEVIKGNAVIMSATDVDEDYSAFIGWLLQHAFNHLDYGLSIAFSTDKIAERGVVATKPLTLDEHHQLISVPRALLITPRRAKHYLVTTGQLLSDDADKASDSQLLSLFLIIHARCRQKSPWRQYIRLLPTHYTSIEWWNDADCDQLQYPTLQTVLTTRSLVTDIVRRELSSLLEWMRRAPSPQSLALPVTTPLPLTYNDAVEFEITGAPITLCEYQWAYATVATRSCYLPAVSPADAQTRHRTVMIPFLDLLNHSSLVTTNCKLTTDGDYQLFITNKIDPSSPVNISIGQQVYISYGALDNWTLLHRYGFVLHNNHDDRCTFTLAELEQFLTTNAVNLSAEDGDVVNADIKDDITLSCHCELHTVTSVRPSLYCTRRTSCICAICLRSIIPPPTQTQIAVMRSCGLTTLTQSSTLLNTNAQLAFECCRIPYDLMTFLKIRCFNAPQQTSATSSQTSITTIRNGRTIVQPIRITYTAGNNNNHSIASDMRLMTESALSDEWIDKDHQRRVYSIIRAFALFLLQQRFPTRIEHDLRLNMGDSSVIDHLCCQYRIAAKRLLLGIVRHYT